MTTRVLQVMGQSAGGIARHVAEVTLALDGDDGLVVDVVAPPGLPLAMPKDPIPIVIPKGPALGHRRAIKELRQAIEQGGYDVVHAHGLRAGIDAASAGRRKGVPTIVTVHNLIHPEVAGRLKAVLYRPAERAVVKLADKILAVSRDIARHLEASASDTAAMKIEVMHLGVAPVGAVTRPAHEVRAEIGIPSDARVVVTASRLAPQKALDVMLEAVTRLDCHLVVLGTGPLEEELRGLAGDLGISGRVHFLGFRTDATDLIAAADVFCLSSVWEGVPLAALEAVQLGTAVVATDVGGTGELIRDRVSGRLVPPRDPVALATALDQVLIDPDARRAYAVAARETFEAEFDRSKMLARLSELYRGAAR